MKTFLNVLQATLHQLKLISDALTMKKNVHKLEKQSLLSVFVTEHRVRWLSLNQSMFIFCISLLMSHSLHLDGKFCNMWCFQLCDIS